MSRVIRIHINLFSEFLGRRGESSSEMVLQKVITQLLQQYLVKTLASSPAFQRLAVTIAGKLQAVQKVAEQTAQQAAQQVCAARGRASACAAEPRGVRGARVSGCVGD